MSCDGFSVILKHIKKEWEQMETKTFREMKYRRLGHSGLWCSEIGLGLWKWGDPSYDGSRVGEHQGFEILDRALELGVTHWDTANSYNLGAGNSERLLGRYFSNRGARIRNMVVLATKIKNPVRDEHEMIREFSPNERGASRKYIFQAVDDCLRRLQTDRIDVLYHHRAELLPDGSWETPLDETWDAMAQLVRMGKVRYLAVSIRTLVQLDQECNALAEVASNTSQRIIGVQNGYNLLQRSRVSTLGSTATISDEAAFLDYIRKKRIGLIPHIPLAVGLLTGRYRKGKLDSTGRLSKRAGEAWRDDFLTDRNLELVEKLDGIARKKQCSMAQLAIAWLLSHDVVCSVIAGVTQMEHLEDNVGAASVSLAQSDLKALDRLTR
jgi:aryl-alcohol dehydrogenase-like predicted oxidoreductase